MKARIRAVLLVLVVVLAVGTLGSCNFLLGIFNHMAVDRDRYNLGNLYMSDAIPIDGGRYGFYIFVTSKELTLDDSTGWSGSGEVLLFALVSPSSAVQDGTYLYSTSEAAFTLPFGFAAVGAVTAGGGIDDVDASYELTGGSVKVRNTLRDGFAFEFDLRARNAETSASADITGRYRGQVTETLAAMSAYRVGSLLGALR